MPKKYKIYYQLLMQRATLVLTATLGGWLSLALLNTVIYSTQAIDAVMGIARVWFISVIPGIICYVFARKEFRCLKPVKARVKILGFKENTFDIHFPQEYKRKYAVVLYKNKKYKCYEADGLKKGSEINCLKFNNTFIPIFEEAKHVKHNNS